MRYLRRISTRRLAVVIAAACALLAVGAGIAIGASAGGPTPEPKPLAQAIGDALGGSKAAEGVSARISFTNEMIDGSGITRGTDPLIAGAGGRLWVAKNGDLRLELQSEGGGGDAQILVKGDRFSIYHAAANTVYTGTLPPERPRQDAKEPWPPTVAAIERVLGRLAQSADVSSAVPSNVGGREAYTVRIAPQRHGGLVGALELAWDAANGAPLKVGVYAKDRNDPVLALEATDVSFGPVASDVFDVRPPADAKVVTLTPPSEQTDGAAGTHPQPVTGRDAVAAKLGFPLRAPATLAGRERTNVALIEGHDGDPNGALVTYGEGLDGIAVLQTPDTGDTAKAPAGHDAPQLPTTDLGGGVTATELRTPLGTGLTFTRDGVRVVVAGSVPPEVARAAARDL